jgi:hypothetical protein
MVTVQKEPWDGYSLSLLARVDNNDGIPPFISFSSFSTPHDLVCYTYLGRTTHPGPLGGYITHRISE